ncbi:MAG TPA: carboxypeptidase regulatory-like domain-containing protein [Terriglobales bacterium]
MRKFWWQLMIAWVCVAAAALAQSASGTISGAVLDPQHKAVAGATVVVVNNALGSARALTTDAAGRFTAAQLSAGGYRLQATAPGLRQARPQAVTLGVGGSVTVDLVMSVAQAGQEVTVTAQRTEVEGQTVAPAVDKDSPQVANTVAGLTVTYLPSRARDFREDGMLAAGTQPTPQGLAVSGQRPDATAYQIDGTSFNDPLQGGARGSADGGFFFPQTAVQEMAVVHAGADADVDSSNGGLFNLATKQGSDRIHGEMFYIIRPRQWGGHDAFGHPLADTLNQGGVGLGGDIIPKRVYYYVGFEQDSVDVPYWTQFQPQAGGAALPAALAAQQGETIGHSTPTALSLRLDINLNPANQLNLDGNYNRVRFSNFDPGSTQIWAAASAGESLSGQSDWVRATLTSTLGGVVNQAMGQWGNDRRDSMPNSLAPEVYINGFGVLGGGGLAQHRYTSRQRGFQDDVAWTWHGQMLHFGGGFSYDPATEEQQANPHGRYDYNSLADYQAGVIRRFQQTFATGSGAWLYDGAVRGGTFYVSDRIKLREDLALTAGLRWQGQWNPQPGRPNAAIPGTSLIPNDLTQWQPRLGLAWNPTRKTVVRLSGGLYDAPTPATLFQRVFTDNGLNNVVADSYYDPSLLALAAAGNGLAAAPNGLTTPAAVAVGIAPGFRNPRSFQTAASLQQELSPRVEVTTGYAHNSTWDLQRVVDANLNAPTLDADGMPIFPATRPLPAVGQLLRNESSGHSSYDGWTTSAVFQLPYSLGLNANYTLARTRDDASQQGPFGVVTALNPFDLAREAAYANQDVRHNFNVSGTDRLPLGFKINPIFVAHSGLPYTPIIGFDTQNDGNDRNDRALIGGQVAGRNALRQPAMYDLDLRFVKDFTLKGRGRHLDLFLDVFNVTNHGNRNFGPQALSYCGSAALPVYSAGQALFSPSTTAFGGARMIQFTARMVLF